MAPCFSWGVGAAPQPTPGRGWGEAFGGARCVRVPAAWSWPCWAWEIANISLFFFSFFLFPLADQAAPVGNATVTLSNVSWQHWIQWYGNSFSPLYANVGRRPTWEPGSPLSRASARGLVCSKKPQTNPKTHSVSDELWPGNHLCRAASGGNCDLCPPLPSPQRADQ